MARRLTALDPSAGQDAALAALRAALDGSGPAVLPVPPGPERARVLGALRPDDPATPLADDDVAVVVATSGSTGGPKGALLAAAALRASARATDARLGGPGRWLLALPAHHVAGVQVLVRSLLAGGAPEPLDLAAGFDPGRFAAATARLSGQSGLPWRRYTSLVPTQLGRLLADPAGREALAAYDAVLVGGAAAPPGLVERARAAGARVVTTYGTSETCGGCVYDGYPLDGVQVAVGDDGRVRIAGPVVFRGYRLRPDLTAAALQDGWHVTADLGQLAADGRLTVLGRADDVVVTGGEKVAVAAVEAALAAVPGVREVAVTGAPDPEWGEAVVAVVVPADPAGPPALGDLRAAAAGAVGRAGAPRRLVVVAALPVLALGKVDRAALRRLAAGS